MANFKDINKDINAGLRSASKIELGDVAEKAITDAIFKDDGKKHHCKISSAVNRKSLRRTSKFSSAMIITPDWTSLDQFSPFYNPKDDKYYCTVHTRFETLGSQPQTVYDLAKEIAVNSLLEVYNKEISDEIISQLILATETPDYFIPPRPSPNCGVNGETIPLFGVRVLTTVPATLFDSIKIAPDITSNESLPIATKEIKLISSEAKERIKNTAITIRNYQKEAEASGNVIHGIVLDKEADRLEEFIFVLENLLAANGLNLRDDREDLIIIGIDDNFKVLYVLFDDGEEFMRLEAGYSSFIKSKSVSNDRTIRLLSEMGKLQGFGRPQFPITDFLRDFQHDGGQAGMSFDKDLFDFALQKASQGKSVKPKDLANFIETSNSRPYKTEEQKQQEDSVLNSFKFVDQYSSSDNNFVSTRTDFVGDVSFSTPNIKNVLDNLKDLDDVFEEFFHRINICRILQVAIDCLKIPDRACRISKAWLISATCDDFLEFFSGSLIMRLVNIPELEMVVRNRIIGCLSRLDIDDRNFLLGRIQFAIGLPITTVSDLSTVSLDVIINALGDRGREFLEAICDDPAARRAIVNAIPDDVCSALNMELSDIIKKCEIPTIKLPNFFPTIDIIASISISIEIAITDAILVALIELIKAMIEQILNCENSFRTPNFGSLNMADLLAKTFDVGLDTESFSSLQSNLMGTLALRAGALGTEAATNALVGLVGDITALISPSELANLLNGNADIEVVALANCLIDTKYQGLKSSFNSSAKIDDFFKSLGDVLDKRPLLEQIAQQSRPEILRSGEICELPEDSNYRRLLADKGLTKEEIDKQVAAAQKRKADMFDNLLDNLLKGNPLKDALPPVFCKKSPDGKEQGMVQRDHPSFSYMLDKTIDVIYDGVHMSFNNEISNFVNALKEITTVQIPREVSRRISVKLPDGREVDDLENPEFRRLISQGVSVEDPDEDGDPVVVFEDIQFTTNFAAKGLKENLQNIQKDSNLFNVDTNGVVSLVIPNQVDSKALLSNVSDPNFNASNIQDETIRAAIETIQQQAEQTQVSSYFINYLPGHVAREDVDQYSIKIDKRNANTHNIISDEPPIVGEDPIRQNILNFIQTRRLERDPSNTFGLTATPFPQAYFGSFLAKIWKEGAPIYRNGTYIVPPTYARGISSPSNTVSIDTILRDKFKTSVHQNLFIDTFAAFSNQVAKSPLFNLKVLSLVDFTPDPIPGQCHPHLLDLEKIKKKMKKAITDSACEEDLFPIVDGLGKSTPNSMEREGIDGAIRTFIRLIVIENILRSIFVFSEFRIDTFGDVDNSIIKFISDRVLRELKNVGQITGDTNFQNEFTEQTLLSYNSFEKQKTNDFSIAAEFFIKTEIEDVVKDLFALVKKRDGSNQLDLDEILAKHYIPLFDAPTSFVASPTFAEDSPILKARFATTERKTFSGEGRSFQFLEEVKVEGEEKVRKQIDIATNINQGRSFIGSGTKFNFGNGNFVLERYIRVSYKNEEDRLIRRIASRQQNEINIIRAQRSAYGKWGSWEGKQLKHLREGNIAVDQTLSDASIILSAQRQSELETEIRSKEFGVLSFEDFNNLLKEVIEPEIIVNQQPDYDSVGSQTIDFVAGLNSIFESWNYGLRLTYVPPLNREQEFENKTEETGITQTFSSVIGNNNNPIKVKNEFDINKSFSITEQVMEIETIFSLTPDGKRVPGKPKPTPKSRQIHQFPIICIESSENLRTLPNSINNINIERRWNNVSNRLLNDLIASEEYKFLFHYCLPIDRMFTLLSIYNITYLSNIEKVSKLFDGTKIAIKSVFQALLNSGNYRYEDQYVNRLGGNIGLNTSGLNNANTDPEVPGTNVAAMAIRTPFLILKGLVELIDPNISIARKIVDAAKTRNKDIPILAASLGLLPMNVFPPPPMGPGIGPPISPLGFIYLALNIDEIFNSAKGKDIKREAIGTEVGIDFKSFSGPTKCIDDGEENKE